MSTPTRPRTIVAFHAHPDDEALLTAGTMARAAAEGHRVVLVLATDGELGLTSRELRSDLAARRLAEARASAQALGVAEVVHLGYADSGLDGAVPPAAGRERFCAVPVPAAASLLADVLTANRADVLLSYDANGGYGHRDHVRVHQVGAAAALLASTPRVLEATIPRDLLVRAIRVSRHMYRYPPEFDADAFAGSFSARADITHRIAVRRYARAKRAAMRAHASQSRADGADRTMAAFLRIPRPAYDIVFGLEWFVDPAHPPGAPVSRDILAELP